LVLISPPSPYRDTPDPNGLPLGLCMLASMVRDLSDVTIIDGYSRALSVANTVDATLAREPDIVGIGMPFSFSETPSLEIAEALKSVKKDLPIVAGGIHATVRAPALIENPHIDGLALGEAELTVAELVKTFIRGGWTEVAKNPPDGLLVRGEATRHPVRHRKFVENLDSLPSPAFDLLEGFPDRYAARMETSRGCGYNCPYCASAAYWGRIYRTYSPKRVVEEMSKLKERWGIRRVSFSDDTFNLDLKRAREIAKLLIDADPGIQWGASLRPELMTEEDLELYVRAGMTGIFLGLESGSPGILKEIKRAHDLDRTRELVARAESMGVEVHGSFMIGLPGEREEDIELTLKYAESLAAGTLGFHIFHPLPGSEYGENPDKYGIKLEIPDSMSGGLGDIDGVAPVRTKYLSPMRILDYYQIARAIAEKRRK